MANEQIKQGERLEAFVGRVVSFLLITALEIIVGVVATQIGLK